MIVKYQPGTWLCLATGAGVILTQASAAGELAQRLWEVVRQDGSLAQVLQVLLAEAQDDTLSGLPALAAVFIEDASVHLAVRGNVAIEARGGSARQTINGRGVTSWREERLEPPPVVVTVVANDAPARGHGLELISGMVLADRCQLVVDQLAITDRSDKSTDAATSDPPEQPHDQAMEPTGDPESPPEVAPETTGDPEPEQEAARKPGTLGPAANTSESEPAGNAELDADPEEPGEEAPEPEPPSAPEESRPDNDLPEADSQAPSKDPSSTFVWTDAADGPGEVPDPPEIPPGADAPHPDLDDYDIMWDGHTQMGGAEHAAVRQAKAEDPAEGGGIGDKASSGQRTPVGAPAKPPAYADDAAANRSGQVLGRFCGQCGTRNPPDLAHCRACKVALTGETVPMARPSLGQAVFSTGEVVELDRALAIGRRPRSMRFSDGSVPHLVTVPSPNLDISRSHLAIELQEWSLLASDMGTTNGTILKREGMPDRRLTPKEQVMVQNGDIFDLGDDVSVNVRSVL
ncbi:MAG: FHA domain-containing protein [Micrococcales bacterium]|nr:FHA domain-containing protein [Micrococcales bacterium]